MIEIHNKSTYQRIYNSFSVNFIDDYCGFRGKGFNVRDSIFEAKKTMKEIHLVIEIACNYPNAKTVMKAYNQLRNDSELIEKAILCYRRMK